MRRPSSSPILDAEAIIQGPWNWPDHRKDLEIFGMHGYVFTRDGKSVRMRLRGSRRTGQSHPRSCREQYNDSFAYLAAVVRSTEKVAVTNRSSLANNLTVVRILDAASRSDQADS